MIKKNFFLFIDFKIFSCRYILFLYIAFFHAGHAKWKDNIIKKAADDFYERQKDTISLQKLVYGQSKCFYMFNY